MVGIRIEGLTKIFPPNVVALNNIDLEIRDGEFIVILGPSGSGKTTLLRIIAGLERPTKGRVIIGNRVVADAEKKIFVPPQKHNVGMVFQNWALYPNMKVFDNIAFPLQIKKLAKEEIRRKVKEVAEVLGIDHLLDRYPRQLSGGQQQRVALARALVKEPEVLLLDEPFSNLDARIRITARAFVKKIQRKLGITTILVTHDQADAFAVGDRIAVLRNGKIIQLGSPEELYSRPANTFIADFIGDPPISLIELPVKNGLIEPLGIRVKGEYDRVIVGIRPDEAIAGEAEAVARLKARVDTVLYIGSRRYLVVDIGGGRQIRALAGGEGKYSEGSEVIISIKRIHVFDPRTENRITTIEV
ncbi:MAG: ABC transporter ATP-binding protein [Pyrodictiaceae archaeon]